MGKEIDVYFRTRFGLWNLIYNNNNLNFFINIFRHMYTVPGADLFVFCPRFIIGTDKSAA